MITRQHDQISYSLCCGWSMLHLCANPAVVSVLLTPCNRQDSLHAHKA